jgi:murein DD-endopeptidase MepM/ murein hydrolase activator NlpD
MDKPKRKLSQRLKDKYRLIIYNDNTFEEVGYIRLKGFNLLWIMGALGTTLVVLTVILISYTSVRELLPDYPSSKLHRIVVMNALKLDSLEHEIEIRDKYFATLNNIISGKNTSEDITSNIDTIRSKNIKFSKSNNDSAFRKQIEREEQFNLNYAANPKQQSSANLSQIHFFTPLRGVITNTFNPVINHYGVDIVAGPNEVIKAVLEGTVIISSWTLETGYIIEVQHDNNLVSVYKHNAEVFKKVGSHVEAGEAIAIVGNSGELTTGPHLHFELWYNGNPINPEDYIVF